MSWDLNPHNNHLFLIEEHLISKIHASIVLIHDFKSATADLSTEYSNITLGDDHWNFYPSFQQKNNSYIVSKKKWLKTQIQRSQGFAASVLIRKLKKNNLF
jgi:hypothetical protein